MAGSIELPQQQRRALDLLRPIVDRLGLYLADGTAIALHLQHRVSRALDLFSRDAGLDLERVREALVALPELEVISLSDAALMVRLGSVPVDIVRYPYPLLEGTLNGPGHFPFASLTDLATMKLSAASRRGIRRDFWDLYEIFTSGRLSLPSALQSYVSRYGLQEADLYHVLRSLTYFEDAEADALLPAGLRLDKWQLIKAWFQEHAAAALRDSLRSG